MKAVHEARAEGLPLTAQIAGRPIGVMMGIGTALNPFTVRPSYKAARKPAASRSSAGGCAIPRCGGRSSPRSRRKPRSPSSRSSASSSPSRWDKFFVMGNPPDYEPGPEKSVAAIAAREGRTPDEVAYDYIIEDEASTCTSRW